LDRRTGRDRVQRLLDLKVGRRPFVRVDRHGRLDRLLSAGDGALKGNLPLWAGFLLDRIHQGRSVMLGERLGARGLRSADARRGLAGSALGRAYGPDRQEVRVPLCIDVEYALADGTVTVGDFHDFIGRGPGAVTGRFRPGPRPGELHVNALLGRLPRPLLFGRGFGIASDVVRASDPARG